jgi:hypothetical protein
MRWPLLLDIHSLDFTPEEVAGVLDDLDGDTRSSVKDSLAGWDLHRGTKKPRKWFRAKRGGGRWRELEFERTAPIRGFINPQTGQWEGSADDLFRHDIRMAILAASPEAPPARGTPLGLKDQQKKQPPRVRTQAELDGLARANEKRHQDRIRREKEAEAKAS